MTGCAALLEDRSQPQQVAKPRSPSLEFEVIRQNCAEGYFEDRSPNQVSSEISSVDELARCRLTMD